MRVFDTLIQCLNTDIGGLGKLREFFEFGWMPNPLNQLYWKNAFWGFMITTAAVALPFYSYKKMDRLKREREARGAFVIGTAVAEDNDLKGTLIVDYTYTFGRRLYSNSMPTDQWLNERPATSRPRRFYVRVATSDPGNAELLLDRPVPDGLSRCPDSGWNHLPPQ